MERISEKNVLVELVGNQYETIIDKLLRETKGIIGLLKLCEEELLVKGCTPILAKKIINFKKLHQFVSKERAIYGYKIDSPKSIANIYMEEMRFYEKEVMKVIFLNIKNEIIDDMDISIGTYNAVIIDPREIFIAALRKKAVHFILIHNHPSGETNPSSNDIELTVKCAKAGQLIGIRCLDHIIIGDGNYSSIRENGLSILEDFQQ